jgi:hypothetical protein
MVTAKSADTEIARRLLLTSIVALATAAIAFRFHATNPIELSDFAQVWAAARGWRHGLDPYAVVGPGLSFPWRFPLVYPLTAVIAAWPVSFLPLRFADPLFVAIGSSALIWALTARHASAASLWVLASVSLLWAVQASQWSTLLTAAVLLPALSPFLICKPSLGLALWIAYPRWRTAAAAAGLGLVSVLLRPSWVISWLHELSSVPHVAPLISYTFVGPLVLIALTRWRRPEARLLVALACVPLTPALYEAVPLFLIPETTAEGIGLAILTAVVAIVWAFVPITSYGQGLAWSGRLMIWCLYLPCLVVILRRPNLSPTAPEYPPISRARSDSFDIP